MPSPETPARQFAGLSPIGVLTADDEGCQAVATRLAIAISGPPFRTGRPTCGRSADLPRGVTALPAAAFQPERPFSGPLFAAIESMAMAGRLSAVGSAAPCMALVVPVERLAELHGGEESGSPPARVRTPDGSPVTPADPPAEGPIVILDHMNLTVRGPLTGRWPAGRPRTFPSMNGVYVPAAAAALVQAGDAAGAAARGITAFGKCEPAEGRLAVRPAVYSRLAVAGVADTGRPTVFEVEQARAAGLSWTSSCLVAPVVIAAYYGLVVAAVGVPRDH